MEHVDRIAQLVATTTPTACAYLSTTVAPRRGLLDGDDIIRLWTEFQVMAGLRTQTQRPQRRPELPTPYGLYFFLYERSDTLVPLYVGKGPLPFRALQHLGLQQYVDQVFAYAFGGVHSHPTLFGERLDAVRSALSRVRLGFVFHSVEAISGAHVDTSAPPAAELERAFQAALRPVLDGRFAPKVSPPEMEFDLHVLAARWGTSGEWASPPGVDALIRTSERCHARVVAGAP